MKVTNKLGLPRPFVDAATSEYRYKDRRYSVTSLQKGVREAILTRRHADEIECDASDKVWAIFGTAVHKVLEGADAEGMSQEGRLEVEMPNGYTLSGIYDLYDPDTETVTDWKTGSVYKVKFNEWDDYREQLLAYCWMLDRMGLPARRGQIVMLLKDHSKSKARFEKDYPPHPVFTIGWDFTEKELDDFGMWAEARFAEIERCESLPDDELPLCTEEERWHRPDTWAVVKRGNKKARRVFKDEGMAHAAAESYAEADGKPYEVQFRKGEDRKCLDYCSCAAFCSHYKEEVCNS